MSAAILTSAVTLTTCINYGVSNPPPPRGRNTSNDVITRVLINIASLFLFQGFGLSC